MTEQTQTPASDAATPATNQPTEPVEIEGTTMTEPKPSAPEPKVAALRSARNRDRRKPTLRHARYRSCRNPCPRDRTRPCVHDL